jgi:NADH:ubiquinone oxidoreductase subunit 5 (subunit L)/multisubunit Na+/H+ antiporter MnhA subunit
MYFIDTFLGQPRDAHIHAHEAPVGMWLAPALPAALSLLISFWPQAEPIETFLAGAAGNAFGAKVKVSLDLFTGFNLPLFLSLIAISLGVTIFWQRARLREQMMRVSEALTFNQLHRAVLRLMDKAAWLVTRTQTGSLRTYLNVMLVTLGGLIILFARLPLPTPAAFTFQLEEYAVLRTFTLILSVTAAFVSVIIRRD